MSIQAVYDAVIDFSATTLIEEVKKEIAQGTEVSLILSEGLIKAMDEVGRRYSSGEFFVPEMLMAARTVKVGLDFLKPYLVQGLSEKIGTVIIGTVKGDLHDIGKNLVAMMMEGAGFNVIDIGVDVDTEKFIVEIQEKKADIVCLSALLTTTMGAMETIVHGIRERGPAVKIMVGGAPVTEDFAQKIGADGFSPDAPGAVRLARKLLAS